MNVRELATHVSANWEEITHLPEKEKHQEGEFPDEVLVLIKEHKVDYLDFCDEWSMLHG